MRKLVAVFFHLPGLRIFFGYAPPRRILSTNALAVLATLAAMVAAWFLADAITVFVVWLVGHMLWGLYLSTQISPSE